MIDDKEVKDQNLSGFAVNIGLFFNIFLSIFKTFFGIFGHSSALLADGINSTSDVVYYIAVKIFLKIANKPADSEHPFGHKQMEHIASIVIAAFIITTAIVIAWDSLDKIVGILLQHQPPEHSVSMLTLYVALFTLVSKIFLTIYTRFVGKKTNNPAIRALASDHLNDIFAILAVIIGIFFTVNGYPWVDPLAGIIVAMFMTKTGIAILKESADAMMFVTPSDEMKVLVNKTAECMPQKIIVESILSHRYSLYYSLNITIGIDGHMCMQEANKLADLFEHALLSRDKYLKYVFIHYHPY